MPPCDVKGQGIRLVDVFLLGPFMIWYGVKSEDVPEAARFAMIAAGFGTILFNGVNLLRMRAYSQQLERGW